MEPNQANNAQNSNSNNPQSAAQPTINGTGTAPDQQPQSPAQVGAVTEPTAQQPINLAQQQPQPLAQPNQPQPIQPNQPQASQPSGGDTVLPMTPKFIIEQKLTFYVNKYTIYNVGPDGEKAQALAYVQQKRFKVKEKIEFFSDEERTQPLFSFRAEKVLDVHGRYFVEDTAGQVIGVFKKEFKQSLVNSTWDILDAAGNPSLILSESNQTIAILRRFIGMVPYLGDLAEIVIKFFRYHFKFVDTLGQEVGYYQKLTRFRDHYKLLMNDQTFAAYDWRVLAAQCVALDALQSR